MPATASKTDWTAARLALLAREKAHTRERDEIAKARRALPWPMAWVKRRGQYG